MANANIFQQYLQAPKSVADYTAEMDRADANQLALTGQRRQNDLAALQADQTRAGMADSTAKRNALQAVFNNPAATDPVQRERLLLANPLTFAEGQAAQKARLEAGHVTAQTDEATAAVQSAQFDRGIRDVLAFDTPDSARAHMQAAIDSGKLPADRAQAVLGSMPTDPAQFPAWQMKTLRALMSAKDQHEASIADQKRVAPTPTETKLGNRVAFIDTNSNSPTYMQEVASAEIGQSADNIATNATSRRGQDIGAGTSRANNRDTIVAENMRAGVMPGGGIDDNTERTAQAIAAGQLPAPTGMALLNPKNQRVLGRVMEINPQYDSTTVDAKKKAARDFTSGTLGNSMRSFSVAGQHLDQLVTLVDALGNRDTQLLNRIGNAYAAQTGNPAPTNFDAAKDVVSKEVVKAIVAGGGGVAEREELSKLMSNAKSPQQLKGVIQQYRNLMGAQHDALLQQRRAAGLPDSTLPAYTDANGAGANADLHKQADAILRRGK